MRSSGLAAFSPRDELFAVPGVGEDQSVIIFKFAIIDLGKSNCDKNELIIKFISEINSAAIKPLAGARARRPDLPAAKSPRQVGLVGWGGHDNNIPQCPLLSQRERVCPLGEGTGPRWNLRPDSRTGASPCPKRSRCPGRPVRRSGRGRGRGNTPAVQPASG